MPLKYIAYLLKMNAAIKHQILCHMVIPSWQSLLFLLSHLFALSLGTKNFEVRPKAKILTDVAWK